MKSHDTDLARERSTFQRSHEVSVHLIGSHDHRSHCVLVLRSRCGQERQSSQRDVVLTVRETALVVAVWT